MIFAIVVIDIFEGTPIVNWNVIEVVKVGMAVFGCYYRYGPNTSPTLNCLITLHQRWISLTSNVSACL